MDLHLYLHFVAPDTSHVDARLDSIVSLLNGLIGKVNTMSAELDALTAAVTQENTVIDSAIVLLKNLAAQIAALKTDPAALQALADGITAKAQALADAIVANTPAP